MAATNFAASAQVPVGGIQTITLQCHVQKTVGSTLTIDSMIGKNLMDLVCFTIVMTSIFSVEVRCNIVNMYTY